MFILEHCVYKYYSDSVIQSVQYQLRFVRNDRNEFLIIINCVYVWVLALH